MWSQVEEKQREKKRPKVEEKKKKKKKKPEWLIKYRNYNYSESEITMLNKMPKVQKKDPCQPIVLPCSSTSPL